MADLLPDEDTAPPADPFEAELVAYLDGELEPTAARKVEARLASDPQARSRATALKKTFDLLDYLPKPEPSAEFTSRTMDKLPALQQGQPQHLPGPAVAQSRSKSSRSSQPVVTVAPAPRNSLPGLSRPQTALSFLSEPSPSKHWVWAFGILIAVTGFAVAGYFGGTVFRAHRAESQTDSNRDVSDDLALPDRQLIDNLPLYAAVDDFEFVNELSKPEYFGDDPTVAYDTALKVPSIPREMPSGNALATLEKAFKQLSPGTPTSNSRCRQESQRCSAQCQKSVDPGAGSLRFLAQ